MTTQGNDQGNDPPNLDTLIKCMKMTTHENDNQALVALRAANKQLAKFGGDWESLLRGKVKIIGDPFASFNMPNVDRPSPRPAAPPPRPAARPTPQPPPRPAAPPPPAQPFQGQRRSALISGNCVACGSFTSTETYSSLLGAWEYRHPAGGCRQRRDNEKPNRFPGKCILCSQRVEAMQGTVYHTGTKWQTEHLKGSCPQPGSRRRKQPLTSDDLMS